jgi:asparagine synthase (glutamine-hydrolysing)
VEAAEELRGLIQKSVRERLDSEVPLGVYLSGGVDSRIIAHEMSRSGYEFPSFTVGFEGEAYDESEEVRAFVKASPGIQGHLLRLTDDSLSYSYPHAIFASELVQPYTNGAAKWWLSRFARQTVRGVLTGDGADEVFCGYPSYRYSAWWDFYSRSPGKFRASLYRDRLGGKTKTPWASGLSSGADGADLLESSSVLGWVHPLFQQVKSQLAYLEGDEASAELWLRKRQESLAGQSDGETTLLRWQNYFLRTHFPTHVLNWVGDRMEMANTLEGRPPFLSRAIMNFMRELPDQAFVRGMRDKAIQRKAYAVEMKDWVRAPKKQFNAPLFYAGDLGQRYLSAEVLRSAGLIDPKSVDRARRDARQAASPLARANAELFLQSALVAHMLDEYLVRGKDPVRDMNFEDKFMNERGELL